MTSERTGVIGIGYEGHTVESLIDSLRAWGVGAVVDVRLNPISRKKGLSKTALGAALAEAGIEYRHMRALGNPKDNRSGFWEPGTDAHRKARVNFAGLLAADDAVAALDEVTVLSRDQFVAVLCFEESERCCHRSLVLDAVKERLAHLVPAFG